MKISAYALGAVSALALGAAAQADEIVIYTNWSVDHVDAFERSFEAANPEIDAVFFRAPIEELFTIIDLENRTGQLRADVIIFGDSTRANELRDAGALAPIELTEEDKAAIDADLQDPEGIIAPYMIQPVVVQYNANLVPDASALDSWTDLLDPAFQNRVAMGDPRVTGMVHPALYVLTSYLGESDPDNFGWGFVDKLATQNPRLETGHRGIRDLVALGEMAIAIQTVDNAVRSVAEGEPTGYFYPVEATPALYQSVGVVAASAELESAKTFAHWLIGPEGQGLVNTVIGALPVRAGVPVEVGESLEEMRERANVVVLGPELTQDVRESQTTQFYERRGNSPTQL